MARNGSGTMSIPNTMVAGEVITASEHNENYSDIVTELTNSVAVDGQSTMTGPLKASNGSVSAPAITFGADQDTGLYRIGSNDVGLSIGGTLIVEFTSTGIAVTGDISASDDMTVSGDLAVTGTTTLTDVLTLSSTSHFVAAKGTTAQRPGSPAAGMTRFNSSTNYLEFYDGSAWRPAVSSRLTATRFYTSSDTWTAPSNLDFIIVEVVGGGGGGGGSTGTPSFGSGGGSSGSYTRSRITAANAGASQTVTVGAGGAGNTAAGGANGGASSFGALVNAVGGIGGDAGTTSSAGQGGASPGSGSVGDFALPGTVGGRAGGTGGVGSNASTGGMGGAAPVYGAPSPGGAANANGVAGQARGSGGSGGSGHASSNTAGGTGSAGLVVVHEYTFS